MSDGDIPADLGVSEEKNVLDMTLVKADIAAGLKAGNRLADRGRKGGDWQLWSPLIKGFRGMRDICFEETRTNDIHSYYYRQRMGSMLEEKKYAAIAQHLRGDSGKQLRGYCYALMDRIDEIDMWFAQQTPDNKLRWQHPNTVAKRAPPHLVAGALRGHNNPPAATSVKKKLTVDSEVDRLRKLLLQVLSELVALKPEASKYLALISPADPNDSIGDIGE